jgi:hypothetical protein
MLAFVDTFLGTNGHTFWLNHAGYSVCTHMLAMFFRKFLKF